MCFSTLKGIIWKQNLKHYCWHTVKLINEITIFNVLCGFVSKTSLIFQLTFKQIKYDINL